MKIFVEWWWLAALGIASAFFYWTPPRVKDSWSPRLRTFTPLAFVIVSVCGLFLKGFTGRGVDDYVSSAMTDTLCGVLSRIDACMARAKLASASETVVAKVEASLQQNTQERLESQQHVEEKQRADSDARLNELRESVETVDPNLSGTVERLASARKAITAFDEGQLGDNERTRLISAGDKAQSQLAESNSRIARLMNAEAAWRANASAFTVRTLADGDRGLNDFDRSRNVRGLGEALRAVEAAGSRIAVSAARWQTLERSVERSNREPIEIYWKPLRSAVDEITDLDRDLASQSQRQTLLRAQGLLNPAQGKKSDFGTIPGAK